MQLNELNKLPKDAARAEFLRCCHSTRWAEQMLQRRPFRTFDHLLDAAGEVWAELGRTDWLEAFEGHPKIGDMDSLRARFGNTRDWSSGEQSGVDDADEQILRELAEGNRTYEKRFGHIFIVCATGKTAAQMLEILLSRMNNNPNDELKIAANEQSKITRIRLEKLCQKVQSQPTC